MGQKIVIAFGGKHLSKAGAPATSENQLDVIKNLSEKIADVVNKGYEVGLVHGNGPQIGRIMLASETSADITPAMPQDVCGAMSQGYIGYHLQQSLKYALNLRGINVPVVTVATQVIVDKNDKAFLNPTKPIGPYYTEEEAKEFAKKNGYQMIEEKKGWRRLVASPLPEKIVELDSVKELWKSSLVISCGGGGIPVIQNADGTLDGVPAVIDKDYTAELLAEQINADVYIILTDVDKVALNYGTENQQDLDKISLKDAVKYIGEGQFPNGTMLPKVLAAMKFVRAFPGRKAIITSFDKVNDALEGKSGTVFSFS